MTAWYAGEDMFNRPMRLKQGDNIPENNNFYFENFIIIMEPFGKQISPPPPPPHFVLRPSSSKI